MMELKIVCQCGQKYKFDVEPVGGRMPFTVKCPVCNTDGTATANTKLAEHFRFVPPPPHPTAPPPVAMSAAATPPPFVAPAPVAAAAPSPPAPAPMAGLRINREASPAPAAAPPPLPQAGGVVPPPIGAIKPQAPGKKAKPAVEGEFSLVRGIIGAVIGALIGCGLLYVFFVFVFRFPLMGIATGVSAGYTARLMARGTDTTLGIITAVIAVALLSGTFVVMYGDFPIFNIISVGVCASVAYRITSE
jgi:hypothetical protein